MSVQAENAVLGSCLLDPEIMNWTYHNVPEDEFTSEPNKNLFKILKRMKKSELAVDITTVEGSLTEKEKKAYWKHILDIMDSVQTVANYRHYAKLMRRNYVLKELDKRYFKLKEDPDDEKSKQDIKKLWDSLDSNQKTIISIKEMTIKYPEILEDRQKGRAFRLLSGYPRFDDLTGGFHKGNLAVIGARTSAGKTSFLLNLCAKYLEGNSRVLFVSAEMLFEELMDRVVSMRTSIYISRLRKGNLSGNGEFFGEKDYKSVMDSMEYLNDKNLWCLEGGKMTVARIRNAIEVINPDIVFVDYLQRFVPPGYNIPRSAFLSDVANELKDIAKEKKVVVVAASQLNRDIEKSNRTDPKLSDFKDSGGIEEAADYSIMLVPEKDDISESKEVKVFVNKSRNGPTGTVLFEFEKDFTKFKEKD